MVDQCFNIRLNLKVVKVTLTYLYCMGHQKSVIGVIVFVVETVFCDFFKFFLFEINFLMFFDRFDLLISVRK